MTPTTDTPTLRESLAQLFLYQDNAPALAVVWNGCVIATVAIVRFTPLVEPTVSLGVATFTASLLGLVWLVAGLSVGWLYGIGR